MVKPSDRIVKLAFVGTAWSISKFGAALVSGKSNVSHLLSLIVLKQCYCRLSSCFLMITYSCSPHVVMIREGRKSKSKKWLSVVKAWLLVVCMFWWGGHLIVQPSVEIILKKQSTGGIGMHEDSHLAIWKPCSGHMWHACRREAMVTGGFPLQQLTGRLLPAE